MFVYCFGSFLLQDLFLSLQVFAFKGQNMTFTVNVRLTCILYCACDACDFFTKDKALVNKAFTKTSR